MKTKNAPKDLKCKINHTFFFGNRGSQKGGRGGGSDTWEIFPKNPVFLGGVASLKLFDRKAKLCALLLVQTTRGFSNPCYYERLGEQFVLSTNLVDKRLCSCVSLSSALKKVSIKCRKVQWASDSILKALLYTAHSKGH